MKGRCSCGKVGVELTARPEFINFCNCSLCSKSGGAWCYCGKGGATISGRTEGFMRQDMPDAVVEIRFCPDCSTTTHWILPDEPDTDRIGINIRIFDPEALRGIEARFPDGRNWDGSNEYSYRMPHEPFDPARHA